MWIQCGKGNSGCKKEKFVLPSKKNGMMNEMKIMWKKRKRKRKKKSCNKTWSTKNQYEISLGECLISLKKFLCIREYSDEM